MVCVFSQTIHSKVGKLRIENVIRFREEWLIKFTWLAKQDFAGVVYPFCKLYKKKIRNRKSAIIQQNNAVDHESSKNAAVVVVKLIFQWLINLSLLKLRKYKLRLELLYDATAQQQLLVI